MLVRVEAPACLQLESTRKTEANKPLWLFDCRLSTYCDRLLVPI
jgi:hypothetical protein